MKEKIIAGIVGATVLVGGALFVRHDEPPAPKPASQQQHDRVIVHH